MSSVEQTPNEEKHKNKQRHISNESLYTNTPYLQNNGARCRTDHLGVRKQNNFFKSQKNTVIAQRVMSAKAQRAKQVHNELQELRCQVHELFNENRLLKNIQKRQDAALAKYEDNASALPKLLENHHAEVSALRAHSKTLRATIRDLEQRLNRSDSELVSVREHYSKLKKIAEDKDLSSRCELQKKTEDLEQRLREMEEKNSLLNRKYELELKRHSQQMKSELAKRRLIEDDLSVARMENNRLKQIAEDLNKNGSIDSTKSSHTSLASFSSNLSLRKKPLANSILSTANSIIQDNKPSLRKYASLPHIINKTNNKKILQSLKKIPEIGQSQNKNHRNIKSKCDTSQHNQVLESNCELTENKKGIDPITLLEERMDNLTVENEDDTKDLKQDNDDKINNSNISQILKKQSEKNENFYKLSKMMTYKDEDKTDIESSDDEKIVKHIEPDKKNLQSAIETAESDSSSPSVKHNGLISSSSVSSHERIRSSIRSATNSKSPTKKQISFETKYGKQKNRSSTSLSNASNVSSITLEDETYSLSYKCVKRETERGINEEKDVEPVSSASSKYTDSNIKYEKNENPLKMFCIDGDAIEGEHESLLKKSVAQSFINFDEETDDFSRKYEKNELGDKEKDDCECNELKHDELWAVVNNNTEDDFKRFDSKFNKYRNDVVEDMNNSNVCIDKHTQEYHKSTQETEMLKKSFKANETITQQLKSSRMDSDKKNKLLAALRAIDDGNDVNTKSEDLLMKRTQRKSFLNELLQD